MFAVQIHGAESGTCTSPAFNACGAYFDTLDFDFQPVPAHVKDEPYFALVQRQRPDANIPTTVGPNRQLYLSHDTGAS